MFSVLDRYIATHVAIATLIVVMTLTGVVLMTQSLRFLELIIESGASGLAFITLSLLALPRFFEVILLYRSYYILIIEYKVLKNLTNFDYTKLRIL